MASYVLLRRLAIVAVLSLVHSRAMWSWLAALQWLLLAVHQLSQPYERRRDNQLETVTLLSLGLQSSLLSIYPPPFLSAALLSAFNALVLLPLTPLVLRGCQLLYTRILHRRSARHAARAATEEEEQDGEEKKRDVEDELD